MIGIIDSGLGGIVTLNHIVKYFKDTSFVCVADQANAPYGEKSVEELEVIARKHLLWFKERNIDTVLVACNTLCSTVVEKLQKEFDDMRIIDIISLTCEAMKNEDIHNILLLATKRSIESKVYEKYLTSMFDCTVYPVVASKWVPAIEGNVSKEEMMSLVEEYVGEYRGKVDAVLLGCTHYPLIKDMIDEVLSCKIYDSCEAVLSSLYHENDKNASVCIYTSGDPALTAVQVKELLNQDFVIKKLK